MLEKAQAQGSFGDSPLPVCSALCSAEVGCRRSGHTGGFGGGLARGDRVPAMSLGALQSRDCLQHRSTVSYPSHCPGTVGGLREVQTNQLHPGWSSRVTSQAAESKDPAYTAFT